MVRSQEANLAIGAFAKAAGVGVETVRYYQRLGLLPVPASGAGIRRYGPDDLKRLRFIRSAQRAGFTLEEARELLTLDARDDRARAQELARDRIAALDARIAQLNGARQALARLAADCASGKGTACPIIATFEGDET